MSNKKKKKLTEEADNIDTADIAETPAEETVEEVIVEEVNPKDLEISDLKDKLIRNVAEFDNYRKRTSKERLDLVSDITAKNLTEFLPVMDNLQRALEHECTDANYKKGIEMIYESFMTALKNMGVEEIETEGADFDPNLHQAVQHVEHDELEEGKIATTFQKGYKIGDKVIRFPMVAVVK